jgi:hypothetical protein
MIWHPQRGQRVELRYRKRVPYCLRKFHGRRGTVQWVALGPGPIDCEVLLDPPAGHSPAAGEGPPEAGQRVVVPRGNLVKEPQ